MLIAFLKNIGSFQYIGHGLSIGSWPPKSVLQSFNKEQRSINEQVSALISTHSNPNMRVNENPGEKFIRYNVIRVLARHLAARVLLAHELTSFSSLLKSGATLSFWLWKLKPAEYGRIKLQNVYIVCFRNSLKSNVLNFTWRMCLLFSKLKLGTVTLCGWLKLNWINFIVFPRVNIYFRSKTLQSRLLVID